MTVSFNFKVLHVFLQIEMEGTMYIVGGRVYREVGDKGYFLATVISY